MLRRIVVAVLEAALAAISIALLVSVMTGSPRGAGEASAAPTDPTTAPPSTTCGRLLCGSTTLPPPPSTSPATTAPVTTTRQTTPATTPKTLAPYTRQTDPSQTTLAPTTSTITTIPSIGGHLPVTPSTVPLMTKQQSSHVSPVFAALSGAGFFVALLIVAVRFLLTRPPKD